MGVKLIKIGRSENNDIVIDNSSISRHHLELFKDEEGNVFITDLDSTNGTTINGRRISESEILKKNDVVKLGTAAPIPWQNYFKEIVIPVKNDVVIPVIEPPVADSNNWVKVGSISAAVVLLFFFLFIYKDSIFGSNNNNLSNNQEQSDTLNVDENDEVTIETHRDNKKKVPKRHIPLPTHDEISYSYDCMDNDLINDMADLETEFIDIFDEEVSLSEERSVGKQLYDGCKDEYHFIYDSRYNKIESIKNKLQKSISSPRGFTYKIYLIESPEVNAFTAGGYIFVTTGMYDYVENDDELACVVGHEIAHNERMHINHQLKKQKVNQAVLGELFGSAADALGFVLTTSFNQKKETESDYYGIDYAVNAGYNSCKVIKLWKRMSEGEGEMNDIDNMMRTHPYSSKRSYCCRNHIDVNYNFNCP